MRESIMRFARPGDAILAVLAFGVVLFFVAERPIVLAYEDIGFIAQEVEYVAPGVAH